MPIDINLLREGRGGDPEAVRESQRRRFASVELVDQCIAKDVEWREAQGIADNLRKSRNQVQQEVGKKKKAKEECDDLVAQIQDFDKRIVEADAAVKRLKEELDKMVSKIGNIVDDSVPVSQDEDADTEVVRTWGPTPTGDHLLHHHDLLWRLGGYEPERGVSVAGHRAYFLRDAGVLLNQALINYGIAFLRKRQYSILQPPYFMNKDVMSGVAQLEQFDEELYKVTGEDDKYLIATSEQPICGFHRNDWLQPGQLPIRYGGVSTCFRKEAGSHGKDTWGIFRVHQFDKVEQFVICDGDLEVSKKMQDEMIAAAEEFYQSLGIAYRVVNIVSGELNNAAIKKYDLEGWFPGYEAYRELVSCSNCTDYQSRSMEIRCGIKVAGQDKKYVHMLNATLCACTRTICAILENNQTPEGVRIPEVLVPFLGGITFFPFVREPRKDAANAKAQDKKKGHAAAQAKAQAPPPPPAKGGGGSVTPPPAPSSEAESLAASITAKGNQIRDLKAAKADKDTIKANVDELLALKSKYKEVTGSDFQAPGAPPAPANGTANNKKAAPPAPAPSPSGGGGPGQATADLIVAKGEEIRKLKADNADKATLEPHIKALLELKAKYKTETGEDYGVAPADGGKKDKKAAAPAEKKAPATKPPPPPAPKGAAASSKAPAPAPSKAPAPTPAPSKPTVPADPTGPLVVDGKPNMPGLDAYLLRRTFMRGFVPSQDDVVVYGLLKGVNLDAYPSIKRWAKHIATYTAAETQSWAA